MSSSLGLVGRRWGSGDRTYVLVHGLGVASRMAAPLANEFRGSATVLAPDLPGFGAAADQTPLSVAQYGELLASRLRRFEGHITLLGCSVGSQVALHAAAHLGDRLHRLVLVSPTVDHQRRRWAQQALRWPAELATQPFGMVRIQLEDHRRAGLPRVLRLFSSAMHDAPEEIAPSVRARALVVRGDRDPLVSTGWAQHLAARFDDAEPLVLHGRHAMTYTEPGPLAAAVRSFEAST